MADIKSRIRFKRGTTTQINSDTDKLLPGAPVFDTQTRELYIGNTDSASDKTIKNSGILVEKAKYVDVLQTTGTSTTQPMSQNATSNELWELSSKLGSVYASTTARVVDSVAVFNTSVLYDEGYRKYWTIWLNDVFGGADDIVWVPGLYEISIPTLKLAFIVEYIGDTGQLTYSASSTQYTVPLASDPGYMPIHKHLVMLHTNSFLDFGNLIFVTSDMSIVIDTSTQFIIRQIRKWVI